MARRRPKTNPLPRRRPWLATLLAYGIGAACAGAGVLVLVFGSTEALTEGEKPVAGSVTRLGVSLIVLGLLATAIIGYMHWLKRRS
ncbi:MAG TPA: hypothetical protein PLE19_16815 [Planctomycetota bacterium]|nr:hypothetical protein [Planctomycetota bacterium]HRR79885.1 hypothetical protein [Planctomycetota bacterium]HRT95511.1 hypothetical protein [Planctomycetota bacterium]